VPHRVVSRFFDMTSGRYFDPGQDCPLLPADDAARLVRAGCLEVVRDGAPPSAPSAPPGPGAAAPPAAGAPPAVAATPPPGAPPAPARPPRRGATPPKE